MKKNLKMTTLTIVFILPFIFQSCSEKVERGSFLPPVKIEIPNDVKNHKETVDYIKSCEKDINELSDRVEYILSSEKSILDKDEKDITLFDRIKLIKLNIELMSAGSSMADELEKVRKYIDNKKNVSNADIQAYKEIEKTLVKRITLLNDKYKYLNKTNNYETNN